MARSSFFKDNLLTIGAKVASVVFITLFNAVVGRLLGPEGKGVAALATMVAAYLGTVGTLAIDYGVIQATGKRKDLLRPGIGVMIWTCLASSVVLTVVLWVFRDLRAYVGLGGLNDTLWALTVASVPLALFGKVFQESFRARGDFLRYNLLEVSRGGFASLFAVLLVWVVPLGNLGAVATVPLRLLATLGLSLWLLARTKALSLSVHRGLWKKALVFGLKSNVGQSLQFLNYRLDVFIVAYFLGTWGVGIYTAAVGLAEMIWYISGSVSLVLFPRSASLTRDEAARLAASAARVTQFISLIVGVLLASLGWLAIWIVYGPRFSASYLPLILILPGVWAFGYGKLSVSYLMGIDKPWHGSWLTLLSLVLMVPLDLVLIPLWGVPGASLASTLVYGLGGLLGLYWFKRYTKSPVSDFLLPRREDFRAMARLLPWISRPGS